MSLSDVFSLLDNDCMFLERMQQNSFILCHVHPHVITGDVNLDYLVKELFAKSKVTIFPFSVSILWKWVTKPSPLSKWVEGLSSISWKEEYLHVIWNFVRLIGLFSLIYLFIWPFIYNDMYIFIVLCVIIGFCVIYFFVQNCFCFDHWDLFQVGSCVRLIVPIFFFFLSISLLSGIIKCPRFILYFPYPNPRISHFSKECWFLLFNSGI